MYGKRSVRVRHRRWSLARSLFIGLAALVLVVPLGLAGQTPSAEGTPPVVATPDAPGFRLVAKVSAEEWVSPLPAPEAGVELGDASLLEALRQGGFVMYLRHASTDFSQSDEDPVDLTDCSTQRNLSEEGRREPRLIGDSIVALDIPIGDVLSSEMCRAWETAELAFGVVTSVPELTSFGAEGAAAEEERIEALRSLLATPPEPGTNTVLVGHLFNITEAAGVTLDEGEAAIFLPSTSRSGTAYASAADG